MFGTDVRSVRKNIQHGPMPAMPPMPHSVPGVINLCLPIGPVHIVLLRHVRVRFGAATRAAVVDRLLTQLRHGGLFFIGTADSPPAAARRRAPSAALRPAPDALRTGLHQAATGA